MPTSKQIFSRKKMNVPKFDSLNIFPALCHISTLIICLLDNVKSSLFLALNNSNRDLEYTHRQIDGILRALRMDLRFYRLALVMCTIGLMVIAPIIVALYANYNSVHIAMIAATLCIVAGVSILLFEVVAWWKVLYCEKAIKKYTEALWQKNFERYSDIIEHRPLLDDNLDEYRQQLTAWRESLWEREL